MGPSPSSNHLEKLSTPSRSSLRIRWRLPELMKKLALNPQRTVRLLGHSIQYRVQLALLAPKPLTGGERKPIITAHNLGACSDLPAMQQTTQTLLLGSTALPPRWQPQHTLLGLSVMGA